MGSFTIQKLDQAIAAMQNPLRIDVDRVADCFISLAVENGKIYLCGVNGKAVRVQIGDDYQKIFSFDDCVGRFRMILARLCVRTQESFPRSFEGGLYGFSSQVHLVYCDNDSAEIMIETSNTLADSHLSIQSC
jgi:hypothetical protein